MNAPHLKSTKRPRVAVVIPKYGLVGGGERFASEITERLAADGEFDIHVLANKWVEGTDQVTFHKVPIFHFPRFLRPLSFAMYAQRTIDKGGFDLVHSHDRTMSADIFSVHCVPHALWVRDVRKKRPSGFDRAVISVERNMVSSGSSSWFLPVSQLAKGEFVREYGTLPGMWEVMHPGVDVARFADPDREACRAEIRERHGIGKNDFLILFVGMNFEVKGLDTIIRSVALARKSSQATNIRLLVVGRGDEAKYRKLAREFGMDYAITFAGVRTKGLETYYKAADLFAMLSRFDTFGMVVLEAMASGLPVLVSSGVGAKDLVKDGVNGFVLDDCDDADGAARCLSTLFDRDRCRAMGLSAQRTAASNDWTALSEKMKALYWDVLSRKGHARSGRDGYREAGWTSR